MKESFSQEINGKFRRKLSESKLCETTKQSYLKRLNVISNDLSSMGIVYRNEVGLNDIRFLFDRYKEEGYGRNSISAMITALRKFEIQYTKPCNRLTEVLREDHKIIFKYKNNDDPDTGMTAAKAIKNGLPPQKYMPKLFSDRLEQNVKSLPIKTERDRDFKASYEFLKHTGMRSGAFFGVKSVGSNDYLGIRKEQIDLNKDGSILIKNIKDKYAREGWTMSLPKGHPAIKPLKKLMTMSGENISNLDQKGFQRRFNRVIHECRRDPDIVEKYGNLPHYTPHCLRATFIHDKVQELKSNGLKPNEAYQKVSEIVNHENSKTTKLYDI